MLVGKEGIAPLLRDDEAIEHCAGRRHGHEAPVRMPVVGKNPPRLMGIAMDRRNSFMPVDGMEERVIADRTEIFGKADEIVIRELLVWKDEHMMRHPGGANGGHLLPVEGGRQIDPFHPRAAGRIDFRNRDHGTSPSFCF